MKKFRLIFILSCIVFNLGITSCSENFDETSEDSEMPYNIKDIVSSTEGIDVDLTKLSSTMVFAEVYNMMFSPDEYIGKTIKARGTFGVYHDQVKDIYYFAVVIADALACCQQGLEFVWAGDHKYPEDYPSLETEIEVIGTFNRYEEDGYTFFNLLTDNVTIVG